MQRFRTGEFDGSSAYRDITSAELETDEHIAAAEEAAEESWVLLKNDNNTLPLEGVRNVAVVGNMANMLALGDYTGSPEKTVNPISGMRTELGAKGIEVNYLGGVADDEKLFNVKSLTLVMKDGKTRVLDLSKAENVSGMTLANGSLTDITPKATAVIRNVDFLNVASVRAEISTGGRIGGSLNISYGKGGPGVAAVSAKATADLDTYELCSGDYTGEDGGYNGKADMYISASAAVEEFTVENYKTQFDAADVIIAYAGTVPKQEGFGEADSSESKDPSDEPPTVTEPILPKPEDIRVTLSYDADKKLLSLKSNTPELIKAAVVKAAYENGVLTDVKLYEPEFRLGYGEAEISDFELMPGDKVFVWDSVEGMRAYSDVFEYIQEEVGEEVEIQSIDWNGTTLSLTANSATGETKVWQTFIGDQRIELSTDIFADTNGVDYKYGDKFTINSLAAYKDRVYAGCDGGYVIVFTTCPKCYKLMQVCEFDIKELEIADNIMTASNGEKSKQINMTDIGGDSITAEEAEVLIEQDAVLVDLRDEADAGDSDAVNVQLADLEAFLADYDADTTIIFGCYSGIRAGEAVKKAKQLGYTNVYNLGSIR